MKAFLLALMTLFFSALDFSARAQILEPGKFQPLVESVRLKYDLPALGAAIVTPQKTYVAVAGVRKIGAPALVSDDDAWHLGSCTKAMTATLAAILIQDKIARWDTTIGEVFPEMKDTRDEYRAVTLRQLLDQRGGFGENSLAPGTSYDLWRARNDSLPAQRLDYIRIMLEQAPAYAPGSKMLYSNVNYVVAGAMLERLSGKSWEDLMREKLFAPLKMQSAGFGPMATLIVASDADEEKIGAPWSHVWSARREWWRPIPPDKRSDNPQVLGPAGTVHASLGDWAKFIQLQLQSEKNDTPLLKREILQELWNGEEYAGGWRIVAREWSDGRALQHNGSNLMNYCVAWLSPSREFAVLIATNSYDETGGGLRQQQACDEVATVAVSQMAYQWEKREGRRKK